MTDLATWTSAVLRVLHHEPALVVEVKEDILTEVRTAVDEVIAANAVTLKALRCLAGQANCIASVLHVWRLFGG